MKWLRPGSPKGIWANLPSSPGSINFRPESNAPSFPGMRRSRPSKAKQNRFLPKARNSQLGYIGLMQKNEPVTLSRDVDAAVIPVGTKVTLQKGEQAYIT